MNFTVLPKLVSFSTLTYGKLLFRKLTIGKFTINGQSRGLSEFFRKNNMSVAFRTGRLGAPCGLLPWTSGKGRPASRLEAAPGAASRSGPDAIGVLDASDGGRARCGERRETAR